MPELSVQKNWLLDRKSSSQYQGTKPLLLSSATTTTQINHGMAEYAWYGM